MWSPAFTTPRRAVIYRRLGIPTVATVTWTVDQVMRRLLPERTVTEWASPSGEVVMVERSVPGSWVGYRLDELESTGRVRIVALSRAGKSVVPKPGLIGQEGDVLHIAVLESALDELEIGLDGARAREGRDGVKVVIAGAGNVGTYLAADLHHAGHEVLLMEIDPDVARRGAGLGVQWMVRDACEVSALDAAGLATADVVVAATGDDEDNLVVSLLAKQEFAVPRVVARVNHPKNHWLFNQTWGVDIAVSTPHLLAALVEEAVSVGSLVRILQLESSGAHLVEVTLAPGSPAAGRELARLGMPREATVVAVVRRAHVVVPRGDTVLEPGDEVLVLASPESEDAVRSLLVAEGQPRPGLSALRSAPAGPAAGRHAPGRLGGRARRQSVPSGGRRLRPSWARPVYGSALAVSTAAALSALMVPLRGHINVATPALVLVVPVVGGVTVGGFAAGLVATARLLPRL